MNSNYQQNRIGDFSGFKIQGRKLEFYDPSQDRDASGKWTGGGGSSSPQAGSTAEATKNAKQTTTVYHGTSADVLKKIKENGLQPSKGGVYGAGVYATDNIEVALEYGAMKAPDSRYNNPFAPKARGRSFIGLIEVIASGFEEVSRYNDPTRAGKGDKKGASIGILLNKSKVPPSSIKSMKLFDLKDVRSWIFEGGVKPKPVAERKLEQGVYYVPIVIHETELTNLEEGKCPVETQDIKANLANRQEAIDIAHYGPANPKEPNEDYWKAKAGIFKGSVEEAKTMRCGNCAGFNQTSKLLNCIKGGIGIDADEVTVAGDLGFCEIFDFKCASLRTCDAWIVGGPITDKTNLEQLKADLLSLKEQGATLLYDPSQERDDSGKWAGSGVSAQGKFIERIKSQNPKADVASEAVKKGVNTVIKGVRGAKIAGQYGATKTAEIKKWLGSSEGKEFLNTAGDTLRTIGAGAIGAIRGVHNDRYKILVGALINPALVPYLAGQAATRGMFNGIIEEYRGQGRGREISNKIREKIGVKPMQAFVETIKLQTKQPPLEDVASYLADVLRVSIEEAIEGKERFEVVSFYDPSQDRDSSGKWTGGGGGGGSKEPEQGMPIYDEDENKPISPIGDSDEELTQAEKIEKELNPAEQEYAQEFMQVIGPPKREHTLGEHDEDYKQDVVGWSKSFAEKNVDKEKAVEIAKSLHKYAGDGHREVNKSLRDMGDLSRKSDSPDLEALQMAALMETALNLAPKIKESVIWRGIKTSTEKPLSQSTAHKLAKTAKVGETISDFGFSSFSLNKTTAEEFSNWEPNAGSKNQISGKYYNSKVLIKVKNADGVGVKMPSFASSFIGEKEVLLRPETPLRITSVKRKELPIATSLSGEDKFVYQTLIEAEIIK